jgi:hypothetical protein
LLLVYSDGRASVVVVVVYMEAALSRGNGYDAQGGPQTAQDKTGD